MFKIDKNKRYIIYGAGGDGIKLLRVLNDANAKVWGFIDVRAESIGTVNRVKVYTLQQAAERIQNKKDFIVIISIKNLFEHSQIARELAGLGFVQCIYKPLEVLQNIGTDAQNQLSNAYDLFILSKRIPCNMALEITNDALKIECKDRLFLQYNNDGNIIAYMPVEMIFNYDDPEDAYGRIGMPYFFPLVELYKIFMGQYNDEKNINDIVDRFIYYSMEWIQKKEINYDESLKGSLLLSRYKAFSEMQRQWELDRDFFVRSAPQVKRSKNGGFYLIASGRNRVAFQIARGCRYIPVCVLKEDYNDWIAEKKYKNIIKYMEQKRIEAVNTIVPHPFFSGLSISCPEYMSSFGNVCINILWKEMFENSRVMENDLCVIDQVKLKRNRDEEWICCFLNDHGCLKRFLLLNGFNVMNGITCDILEEMLDDLLTKIHCEPEKPEKSTTLIVDSRKMGYLQLSRFKNLKTVFLLNWGNSDENLDYFMNYGFKLKDRFFVSLWNMQHIWGGVSH